MALSFWVSREARPAAEIAMSTGWREACREELVVTRVAKGRRKEDFMCLTSHWAPEPQYSLAASAERPYSVCLGALIRQLNPGG